MKRLHVHIAVDDLAPSISFYSALFAAEPSVVKSDYAKWMLDDPRVNFAISARGRANGLDHLGIQVEDQAELAEVYGRLAKAEGPVLEQGATTCCYAKSEKSWIVDPQGIAWETYLTLGESTVYGDSTLAEDTAEAATSSCCAPSAANIATGASGASVATGASAATGAKDRPAKSTGCCAPSA